ncbi:hypothetical protein K501DRAFT_293549 [Backusella circina FSU 941]|nr:hypothetical protein K501DRAFT_293549 [Backusella circina FSU 941]
MCYWRAFNEMSNIMSNMFYREDRHGNAVDEYGKEPVLMEVDNEGYPLADTVDLDSYLVFKPPKKPKIPKSSKKEAASSARPSNYYKKHGDEVKRLTTGKAGKQLSIARRTAYDWLQKDQKEISEKLIESDTGRPALLGEEHKKLLTDKFIDHPSATLDQAMESLTTQFSDLKVSKTTVYNFMTEKCTLSFKKAHFHSKERNSPANIQKRFEWVVRWAETDMDFNSNCVFIDESAFHINLKKTMAW